MRDFFITLYSNENFPMILGGIIVILLIAFFVVFFLGKKDQKKIEATQRLEKLKTADGFKEVSSEDTVEIELPKLKEAELDITGTIELPKVNAQHSNFELTGTIEIPKLNPEEETHLPLTVDLEDFERISESIDLEMEALDNARTSAFEHVVSSEEEVLDFMPRPKSVYEETEADLSSDMPRLK